MHYDIFRRPNGDYLIFIYFEYLLEKAAVILFIFIKQILNTLNTVEQHNFTILLSYFDAITECILHIATSKSAKLLSMKIMYCVLVFSKKQADAKSLTVCICFMQSTYHWKKLFSPGLICIRYSILCQNSTLKCQLPIISLDQDYLKCLCSQNITWLHRNRDLYQLSDQ